MYGSELTSLFYGDFIGIESSKSPELVPQYCSKVKITGYKFERNPVFGAA